MSQCPDCSAVRFMWGWGHGVRPTCNRHWHWHLSIRWFRRQIFRDIEAERKRADEIKQAARARRLERRRQRRALEE